MKHFWPSLFAFLIVVFLMIGYARPDLMDAALRYLGVYLIYLGWFFLSVLAVGAALMVLLVWRKQSLAANRPVDGAFPLQRYRLKGGRTLIVNPNTMVSPAAIVDKREGYAEWEHPAGWEVLARIRELVERANMVRAMFPGDHARTNPHGAMSAMPRLNASSLKQLEAKPPKVIEGKSEPVVEHPPLPPINVQDAIATSTTTNWAVGQDRESGEIVRWDLTRNPHVRWHGATQGSGKTNACKTLLVGALLAGCHVIVCDRRRFKDFGAFQGKVELVATNDPRMLITLLQRLAQIYQQRDRMLAAHGAANIGEVRGESRYVVLVTEFGALCTVAQAEGVYGQMVEPLTLIMREAGATGVHLLFEDQVVEKGIWPGAVLANSTAFIGRLPSRAGQAVGYYHSDKLPPYHFYYEGRVLKTWDMRPVERRLLAAVPAFNPQLALGVREGVHGGVREDVRPLAPSGEGGMEGAGTGDEQEDDYWAEVVADWFDRNPDALTGTPEGISDLARAMSFHQTGSPSAYRDYKSRAHRLYHAFRDAASMNNHPLGMDILTEYTMDKGM